ncbi:hypothetical protein DPMN_018180 [Dreissena polymorpha]|uniref:Uncharacterized protein n=2 Tax=Dreissena polymorpha TaxID=45954 RepID=A0A9D4NHX8_DREPO|nr:hypothetical protein DPMN_018180 [Dreissena polymorpha]
MCFKGRCVSDFDICKTKTTKPTTTTRPTPTTTKTKPTTTRPTTTRPEEEPNEDYETTYDPEWKRLELASPVFPSVAPSVFSFCTTLLSVFLELLFFALFYITF